MPHGHIRCRFKQDAGVHSIRFTGNFDLEHQIGASRFDMCETIPATRIAAKAVPVAITRQEFIFLRILITGDQFSSGRQTKAPSGMATISRGEPNCPPHMNSRCRCQIYAVESSEGNASLAIGRRLCGVEFGAIKRVKRARLPSPAWFGDAI